VVLIQHPVEQEDIVCIIHSLEHEAIGNVIQEVGISRYITVGVVSAAAANEKASCIRP